MRFNVFSISTGALSRMTETHLLRATGANPLSATFRRCIINVRPAASPVCEHWAPTESAGLQITAKDPETGKNNRPVKSVNRDDALIPVQPRGRSKYDAADVHWEVYHRPAAS